MGGKAHGDGSVSRMSTRKWRQLYLDLKDRFEKFRCVKRIEAPRLDPGKGDHGDVDLIALIDPEDQKTLADICAQIKLTNRVGHSYLYEYQNEKHQIDLRVFATEEEFALVQFCHSYGDIGVILGVCARAAGLQLSERDAYI